MAGSRSLRRSQGRSTDTDNVHDEASMPLDTSAENSHGSPLIGTGSSQSFKTGSSRLDGASSETVPPESGPSLRKPRTKRGRNGKKWIGLNWEHKEHLKQQNDGKLPQIEALTTSSFPHQDEWSEDNLPEILFYIKPPKSPYEGEPVSFVKDNGKVVKVGIQQKPLRDFPILPRRISLDVPGWLVEAWRRIDPRITYPDILDRQIEDPAVGLKKLDKNALQNHCRRECRMVLGMWTNYERRDVPHRTDVESIEDLSYQNIMLNTILNVSSIWQDRLIKVHLTKRSTDGCGKYYAEPCEVTETNLYEATFPIDHFVLKSELPPATLHSMSDSMSAAWELSLILQERARLHNMSHWRKLADGCRPVSWFDRTVNKRTANDTFDGGCAVCTWIPGRDQRIHKQWMDEVRAKLPVPANRKTSAKKGSSAQISKRRKLKDGSRQDGPVDAEDDECECCQDAESLEHSAGGSGNYFSDQSRSGEVKSYFRDADDIEKTQIHKSICKTKKRGGIHEGKHHIIERAAEDSLEPGIRHQTLKRNRKRRLSSSLRTRMTSVQKPNSGRLPALLPKPVDVKSTLPQLSRTEKDLNGIGTHLTMGGGDYPLTHVKDETARTAAGSEGDMFEAWDPTSKAHTFSESPVAGGESNEDLEALWWAWPGAERSKFQNWDQAGSSQELTESIDENATTPELIKQHTIKHGHGSTSDLPSYLQVRGHLALGGGTYNPGPALNGAWSQPLLPATEGGGFRQGWEPTSLSHLPATPDLTTSFPTLSETSDGERASLGRFSGNQSGNPAELGESANIIGLPNLDESTTNSLLGHNGKEPMREVGPPFVGNSVNNPASSEDYMDPSDSFGSVYGYDGHNNYTNGNIPYDDAYLFDNDLLPLGGSIFDFH